MRVFNTTGPVREAEHYCVPPLSRLDIEEVRFLIDQQTRGQPWLVNALAYDVFFRDKTVRSRRIEAALDDIRDSRERLILRRNAHLDQLAHKLEEERVRRVVWGM